ncbi:hypothetical protein JTE90_022011 [Oedothorax gibbosus]|uniref:CYTH domain-containing protein n=1 Tax=Oedothorax gibbosus TaxID=931172 RepID=A0AAV6V1E0_9ARAC|nr:hypothetical protein JTE90_022011 [Oedothorax gibbosus]
MSKNVEIKARIHNIQLFVEKAKLIADKPSVVVLHQTDTYFQVPKGRLKLRQIQDQKTELIFYDRPDTEGPKLSNYDKQEFQTSQEAEGLKKVLTSSLGIIGVVSKERHLLMCGQTRIHIDNVKDLGHFMELEVVLNEGETLEYGEKVANDLMEKLGISKEDLISGSYINLLTKSK